jgi:hypothetical protein
MAISPLHVVIIPKTVHLDLVHRIVLAPKCIFYFDMQAWAFFKLNSAAPTSVMSTIKWRVSLKSEVLSLKSEDQEIALELSTKYGWPDTRAGAANKYPRAPVGARIFKIDALPPASKRRRNW